MVSRAEKPVYNNGCRLAVNTYYCFNLFKYVLSMIWSSSTISSY